MYCSVYIVDENVNSLQNYKVNALQFYISSLFLKVKLCTSALTWYYNYMQSSFSIFKSATVKAVYVYWNNVKLCKKTQTNQTKTKSYPTWISAISILLSKVNPAFEKSQTQIFPSQKRMQQQSPATGREVVGIITCQILMTPCRLDEATLPSPPLRGSNRHTKQIIL